MDTLITGMGAYMGGDIWIPKICCLGWAGIVIPLPFYCGMNESWSTARRLFIDGVVWMREQMNCADAMSVLLFEHFASHITSIFFKICNCEPP